MTELVASAAVSTELLASSEAPIAFGAICAAVKLLPCILLPGIEPLAKFVFAYVTAPFAKSAVAIVPF